MTGVKILKTNNPRKHLLTLGVNTGDEEPLLLTIEVLLGVREVSHHKLFKVGGYKN